jgi:hypothetical protein
MPLLKYWDVATGAFIAVPGAQGPPGGPGSIGTAGAAGAIGPAGVGPKAGVWAGLPYTSAFTDFGSGWRAGQYMKDSLGWVYLRGLCSCINTSVAGGGSGPTICTLPSGFRPANRLLFSQQQSNQAASGGPGRVDIVPDGTVVTANCSTTTTGYTWWQSVSGIRFLADGN